MSVEPPPSGPPTGPPSGPLSGPSRPGPPTGPPSGGDQGGTGRGGGGGGDRGSGGGHDETIAVGTGTGGGPYGPRGPGGGGGSGGGDDSGRGSGPPSGPGGPGGGSGDGATPARKGGPDRPWWRSAPRVALTTGVIVAAVALIIVFTRPDGSSGKKDAGGEVFLQAAGKDGPRPFTPSSARYSSPPPSPPSLPSASAPTSANVTRGVDGSAPGLYGGTRNRASCDVEKQIGALAAEPAKNKAFASVLGIAPDGVPSYLRALTPVQLRVDTRVTNHGYENGSATSYQAVLQAGTAVLVDDRGVPRVRCACGNPLMPPVAQRGTPKPTGDAWPAYRPSNVAVVAPAARPVHTFVMFDPDHEEWFSRPQGDTGGSDRKTPPPSTSMPYGSSPTNCASPYAGSSAPASCAPSPASASGSARPQAPASRPPTTSAPAPGNSTPYAPVTSAPASAPGGY